MKTCTVLLSALLLFNLGCQSETIDAKTGEKGGAYKQSDVAVRQGSKAEIESTHYDFGVMEIDEKGEHTFKITSGGEEPLEIKLGEPSCQCTASGLSSGGKTLDPGEALVLEKGESAQIKVSWSATDRDFDQDVPVFTSDPDNQRVLFRVTGRVQQRFVIEPQGVWVIGTIDGTGTNEYRAKLYSGIVKEFKILLVTSGESENSTEWKPLPPDELKGTQAVGGSRSPDGSLTARWRPLTQTERNQRQAKCGYQITLTFPPKNEIGRFRKKLLIRTDVPRAKGEGAVEFAASIRGTRRGPILLRPLPGVSWHRGAMQLNLGRFPAAEGNSAKFHMFVSGPEGKEFQITKVESDPAFLQMTIKPDEPADKTTKQPAGKDQFPGKKRNKYILTVLVPPGEEPAMRTGQSAATMTIHTNHDQAQTLKLSVEFHSY